MSGDQDENNKARRGTVRSAYRDTGTLNQIEQLLSMMAKENYN